MRWVSRMKVGMSGNWPKIGPTECSNNRDCMLVLSDVLAGQGEGVWRHLDSGAM